MSIVSESIPRTDADKAARYAGATAEAVKFLTVWEMRQSSTYPDSLIAEAKKTLVRALKDGGDWRDDG
jgi:hypothetical protein